MICRMIFFKFSKHAHEIKKLKKKKIFKKNKKILITECSWWKNQKWSNPKKIKKIKKRKNKFFKELFFSLQNVLGDKLESDFFKKKTKIAKNKKVIYSWWLAEWYFWNFQNMLIRSKKSKKKKKIEILMIFSNGHVKITIEICSRAKKRRFFVKRWTKKNIKL